MSISLNTLDFLASEQGQDQLKQLIHQNLSEQNTLKIITRLRRDFNMEQASALLSMAKLRQKAITKFGDDASKMFFTDAALQQSSDPLIRNYRTQTIEGLSVLDVCCGIGADSFAFAAKGAIVKGIDIDPLRIGIADYNAAVLGLEAQFEVADAITYMPLNCDIIFLTLQGAMKQANAFLMLKLISHLCH